MKTNSARRHLKTYWWIPALVSHWNCVSKLGRTRQMWHCKWLKHCSLLGAIRAVIRTRPCATPPLLWVWIGAACIWIEPPQVPSTSRTLWKRRCSTQRVTKRVKYGALWFQAFFRAVVLRNPQYRNFSRYTVDKGSTLMIFSNMWYWKCDCFMFYR